MYLKWVYRYFSCWSIPLAFPLNIRTWLGCLCSVELTGYQDRIVWFFFWIFLVKGCKWRYRHTLHVCISRLQCAKMCTHEIAHKVFSACTAELRIVPIILLMMMRLWCESWSRSQEIWMEPSTMLTMLKLIIDSWLLF